ncbi:MAG: hypothetical protein ACREJC_18320 [Tepidisphaeraceae bacterium]
MSAARSYSHPSSRRGKLLVLCIILLGVILAIVEANYRVFLPDRPRAAATLQTDR